MPLTVPAAWTNRACAAITRAFMAEEDLKARVVELEAELSRLRELESVPYRAVVEDMSELVVRWKPDGTRLFVNDAYCRLFGATRETLIGSTFWPLISDDDRREVHDRIAALSYESPVSTGQHRAIGPGGTVIWMEWVDRAIYDREHRLVELQSVGRDITARVHLEDQARRVVRGDAAARASAAIAHDLRSLLLVIGGFASLEVRKQDDVASLETVRTAVKAADRLLTQLSQVRHGVTVEPQRIDVSERVSQLRSLLREIIGRGVRLELKRPAELCEIVCDPTQIDQILLNLARNAVEAMPTGGALVIETDLVSDPGVTMQHEDGSVVRHVHLRVTDTGTGISDAILTRIFDVGISTKPGGHGLGLATVKAIVESHGGSIRVRSGGHGTTFDIAFPAAD